MPDQPTDARRHCRHYSFTLPALTPVCALGLDPGALSPVAIDWPCVADPIAVCSKREEKTAEEIAAEEAAHAAATEQVVTFLRALPKDPKITRGSMPCPRCGGTLHWARVGRERHMRAACETPKCFSVMS